MLAYTLVQAALFPIILIVKVRRHRKGYVGEFDARRWTVPGESLDSSGTGAVVFVGAGPGELIMIDRIVEEMRVLEPNLRTTICLRDLSAIDRLRRERPWQRFTIWPFDHLVPVARWLRLEQPRLVVFVDRFRFPAFACGLAASGVRVALVNGRCRRRTSGRYRLSGAFYRWQVSAFDLLSMESSESEAAIRPYASPASHLSSPGSLKADFGHRSPGLSDDLAKWLLAGDDRPIVAAGSTQDLEEEHMVLAAFGSLRAGRACRLLLAPRNPERAAEVAQRVEACGLTVGRRSEGRTGDVLLLDTFGELATAYSAATSAYVGGFMGGWGGHNVMEPLRWGVPIAYGPYRGNFDSLQTLCESRNASRRVRNAEELSRFWAYGLDVPLEAKAMGDRGKRIVEESQGAVAASAKSLLEVLTRGPKERPGAKGRPLGESPS